MPQPSVDPTNSATGHLLGPHVVGQRVVIRRVLPGETGPSGGPSMTDVLGVCEQWPRERGGLVTVRREDGELVSFPTDVIVSGKPVPPRPSVRHRVSAADAERHSLALFPDLVTASRGPWVARSEPAPAGRLRKRANSCLAFEDPGDDPQAALDWVVEFYTDRGRVPLLQVELAGEWEAVARSAGWSTLGQGDSDFRIASVAQLRRELGPPEQPTTLTEDGLGAAVEIVADSQVLARGLAAFDADWLGLHGLWTHPDHRRRGLARQVLAALNAWGAERGALTAWLHVETDNAPALALYGALGFRTHHLARYLVAPGHTWADSATPATSRVV